LNLPVYTFLIDNGSGDVRAVTVQLTAQDEADMVAYLKLLR
jgi:hypothetical protein